MAIITIANLLILELCDLIVVICLNIYDKFSTHGFFENCFFLLQTRAFLNLFQLFPGMQFVKFAYTFQFIGFFSKL